MAAQSWGDTAVALRCFLEWSEFVQICFWYATCNCYYQITTQAVV